MSSDWPPGALRESRSIQIQKEFPPKNEIRAKKMATEKNPVEIKLETRLHEK